VPGLRQRSCYVTQAGYELTILLPQPPKYWDYRTTLNHLTTLLLSTERPRDEKKLT
jgi:hypothetical protein